MLFIPSPVGGHLAWCHFGPLWIVLVLWASHPGFLWAHVFLLVVYFCDVTIVGCKPYRQLQEPFPNPISVVVLFLGLTSCLASSGLGCQGWKDPLTSGARVLVPAPHYWWSLSNYDLIRCCNDFSSPAAPFALISQDFSRLNHRCEEKVN